MRKININKFNSLKINLFISEFYFTQTILKGGHSTQFNRKRVRGPDLKLKSIKKLLHEGNF
jgi:hypothetical protein